MISASRSAMRWSIAYLSKLFCSASPAILKLSSPAQPLTRRLSAKKPAPSPPVCRIPISRKCFAVSLLLGFGFSSRLNDGKTDCGIEPRDDAGGGGCGGGECAGASAVGAYGQPEQLGAELGLPHCEPAPFAEEFKVEGACSRGERQRSPRSRRPRW